MQTYTAAEIIKQVIDHMNRCGQNYSNWYVGITGNIEQRLFGDHNVPRQNHWFIWRRANSELSARQAESELLELGCKGGEGGGTYNCDHVYAYVITAITRE